MLNGAAMRAGSLQNADHTEMITRTGIENVAYTCICISSFQHVHLPHAQRALACTAVNQSLGVINLLSSGGQLTHTRAGRVCHVRSQVGAQAG